MDIRYNGIINVDIPDRESYRETVVSATFKPWCLPGELHNLYNLIEYKTLVSVDRCYYLYKALLQCMKLKGEIWECGVYKGGTADMFAMLRDKYGDSNTHILRLFDTFEGMPECDLNHDFNLKGMFSDTSFEQIKTDFSRYKNVFIHRGFIPDTFEGLEIKRIAFLHCDLDIYKSIIDNLNFCYPRMLSGGFIIFDDYGYHETPGARKAVDEFFGDKPEEPLVLATGQAMVVKI